MPIIITKIEKNLGKVAFLIVYSLVIFWFVINGSALFPDWNNSWTYSALIYITGVSLFVGTMDIIPKELKSSFSDNLKFFSASSIFTLLLLLVMQDTGVGFQNISPMPYNQIPANLVYQLVVVASSEEILFRGVVFGYLYDRFKLRSDKKNGWIIPYVVSALVFALFHFSVYGLDFGSFIMLFALGIIFAYAVDRWGLGASIGAHWIWNCIVMGALFIPH